jgi:hypothetical protein
MDGYAPSGHWFLTPQLASVPIYDHNSILFFSTVVPPEEPSPVVDALDKLIKYTSRFVITYKFFSSTEMLIQWYTTSQYHLT